MSTIVAATVRTDNLTDTGSSDPIGQDVLYKGTIKAYSRSNASAGINDSYNLSSITDEGTGEFRADWSITLDASNYAAPTMAVGQSDRFTSIQTTTTSASGDIWDASTPSRVDNGWAVIAPADLA